MHKELHKQTWAQVEECKSLLPPAPPKPTPSNASPARHHPSLSETSRKQSHLTASNAPSRAPSPTSSSTSSSPPPSTTSPQPTSLSSPTLSLTSPGPSTGPAKAAS
ncbi:hypothetical protein F2Q68_00032880 [Brassica cretica]|uniref:Uncharacterized protein n=1 Tax=Brassica cretica TaxID=69181 RepID=A0A8S9GDN4_BRACR|nr:hypothetical protein F2Q68_00032880 [Brassica cretica]